MAVASEDIRRSPGGSFAFPWFTRFADGALEQLTRQSINMNMYWAEVPSGTFDLGLSRLNATASQRASTIQGALSSRTQRSVTTAVTETREGVRVVTSSEGRLRPAQRALLAPGEVAGVGQAGTHAEINGINAARQLGLTPIAVAPSRSACWAICRPTLSGQGIGIIDPE